MTLQVLFFGTSEIAVPVLKKLSSRKDINLTAVITQPDRPAGRKQEITASPVKLCALEKEIPTLQPEKIRGNKEFFEIIKKMKPDIIVVISYGSILPKEILELSKFGAVNIHPSLLPKYRGASPINEVLLRGDKETGVAFIKMNEKMDEGSIILIKKIKIEEDDDCISLQGKLSTTAAQLIIPVLIDYIDGILKPLPQDNAKASYCNKMSKEDGKINWNNETAEEIHNKIRAFIVWPGTFTTWRGKIIKIKKSAVLKKEHKEKPGTIIFMEKTMAITCKKEMLIPLIIQLEGKKETTIENFFRGYEKELRRNPRFGM